MVVLHAFCEDCFIADWEWRGFIQDAIREWNTAGADFTFHTRNLQSRDDPCNLPNEVVIIDYAGPSSLCPGDGPMPRVPGPEGLTEFRLGGARIYLQVGVVTATRLLIHELGHVVGLDHPDEAGQNVQAIMNSRVIHETLQPDDIAGIQALYPLQEGPEAFVGFLENPRDGSSHSGISVISGWVCDADRLLIDIRRVEGNSQRQVALLQPDYGTERTDTAYAEDGTIICGDTDNGFGILFNWNQLGDGTYAVYAEVDGYRLNDEGARITVTTLDGEFPRGLSGQYTLEDFPYPGESVVIEWEESLQNFVIKEHR